MEIDCLSCGFMNALYVQKEEFSITLYRYLAYILNAFLGVSFSIYVFVKLLMGLLENNLLDELRKVGRSFFLLMWVVPALNYGVTVRPNETPIPHGWFLTPVEQTSGAIGMEIIRLANSVNVDPAGVNRLDTLQQLIDGGSGSNRAMVEVTVNGRTEINYYSVLALGVERSMYYIVKLGWTLFGFNVGDTIIGLLLVLPYLFVIMIFAAFMVEAMFSYLSMAMLFPFALYCLLFPSLRPFTFSTLRIVLGASLTIFFAAGAMGFSIAVVDTLGSQYVRTAEARERINDNISRLRAEEKLYCRPTRDLIYAHDSVPTPNPDFDQARCDETREELSAETAIIEQLIEADKNDDSWLVLILMGGVSVLLHLKSKTLASNISGAQDGAGPAAATVAATKALALGGLAAGNRALVGQGGFGGQIFGDGGGAAGGLRQAAQQGGMAGMLRNFLPGGGGGGDENGRMSPYDYARESLQGSESPYSTGAAAAGSVQTVQLARGQIQELAQAIRTGGTATSGQDREGNDL